MKSSSAVICASVSVFMWSRSAALDMRMKAVMMMSNEVQLKLMEVDERVVMSNEVQLKLMEVDERVVMSNEAAARRISTCGNNEALL
jgi:hypothetical protein